MQLTIAISNFDLSPDKDTSMRVTTELIEIHLQFLEFMGIFSYRFLQPP